MALAASVEKATRAMFRSRYVEAAESIRQRIETAEAQLAELHGQYPELSLAVATQEEGAVERMAALAGEIGRAEGDLRLLRTALSEAERREGVRIQEATQKADASRVRALSQHLGKLRVASQQFERGVADMAQGWAAMLDAVRRAKPLLEGSKNVSEINGLNPSSLTRLCNEEIGRQAYTEHPSTVLHPLPGSKKPMLWSRDVIKPSLSDRINDRCEALIQAEGGRGDGSAGDDE